MTTIRSLLALPACSFLLAGATLLTLSSALPAQGREEGKVDKEHAEQEQEPKPAAKATAWPDLSSTDRERVLALEMQFRKDDPKLHDKARPQLIALGAGAVPLLLLRISDRDDNHNGLLISVLDALIETQHSALLAEESKRKGVELRRYLTTRLARFHEADLLPTLQTLRADDDPITSFRAAVGCLALDDGDALAPVLSYSKTHWEEEAEFIAAVLSKARSPLAGNRVFEVIAKAPPADQMAGLRIARYLAVDAHKVILRTYLQASDHTVKKEAVNACRVLAGEAPMEKLSVFQAIKLANEWLKKL